MRKDTSFALILLCFFLSGVAGLVCETLWTRECALVCWTSELALATVLALLRGPIALRVAQRGVERNLRTDFIGELPDGLHVVLCGTGSPLADADHVAESHAEVLRILGF